MEGRIDMKDNISRIISALFVSIVSTVLVGCNSVSQDSRVIQDRPESIPLSEFVLGSWKTEHVYLPNGNESVFGFDVTFKDYETVEVVTLQNGEPTERTVSKYSFVSSDIIFVDNKRISGGETWHLEREGQKLIVLLEIIDGKEGITLVLVRKK